MIQLLLRMEGKCCKCYSYRIWGVCKKINLKVDVPESKVMGCNKDGCTEGGLNSEGLELEGKKMDT